MTRGRGNHSRGARGGRGGMQRAPNNTIPNAPGPGVASETLLEDVYEPAPPTNTNAAFLNGSAASSTAYFEEFPKPGMAASGDGSLPGFQRQSPNTKNIKLQQKNHLPTHTATAAVSGASASTQVQQRAY